MEAKHTMGTWEIWSGNDDDGYEIAVYREDDDAVQEICKVEGWVDEAKANASLIAAAPELLEALEMAYAHIQTKLYLIRDADKETISSAIAKAKGEEDA